MREKRNDDLWFKFLNARGKTGKEAYADERTLERIALHSINTVAQNQWVEWQHTLAMHRLTDEFVYVTSEEINAIESERDAAAAGQVATASPKQQ